MPPAPRVAIALLGLAAGCGGAAPPAPLVLGVAPVSSAVARALIATHAPAAPAEATRADPAARAFLLEHLAEPSVPPSSEPPSRVAALALAGTALGEAGELTPDGPPLRATLRLGQRLTVPVSLAAGACVTLLAQGGLGVVELDLFLVQGRGDALQIVAEDLVAGPIAVIGGRRGCFSPPGGAPLTAELHAIVRRGDGPVLLQIYRRDGAPPADSTQPASPSRR